MTIASALTALNTDIVNARTAITNKGGTVTSGGGSSQLATDIATIPSGGSAPVITSLSVTPTTSTQTITAPSGTDGYSPVNVAAVTATIDANITAGNIKKDVQILGVTGTYEGSGGGGDSGVERAFKASFYVDINGNVHNLEDINGATIASNTSTATGSLCNQKYVNDTTIKSVDLSSFTSASGNSFFNTFYGDTSLDTADVSGFETLSDNALNSAFYNTKISSLIFSNLNSVNGSNVLGYAAAESNIQEIRFLKLKSIPAVAINPFGSIARNTNSDSLNIYFNSIQPSYIQSVSAFRSIASGTTGAVLHFPSNCQSRIEELSNYPLFGGTDTVLSFDLPATS